MPLFVGSTPFVREFSKLNQLDRDCAIRVEFGNVYTALSQCVSKHKHPTEYALFRKFCYLMRSHLRDIDLAVLSGLSDALDEKFDTHIRDLVSLIQEHRNIFQLQKESFI